MGSHIFKTTPFSSSSNALIFTITKTNLAQFSTKFHVLSNSALRNRFSKVQFTLSTPKPVSRVVSRAGFGASVHWGQRSFRSGRVVAMAASDSVPKSDDEWRAILSPEQFRILRQKGTDCDSILLRTRTCMNIIHTKTNLSTLLKQCARPYSIMTKNQTLFVPSTYSKNLQLCIDNKFKKEGRVIHTHLVTNGLVSNLNLNTKLIIFYVRTGDTVTARNVFDRMSERSVVSWTAMISGYSQNGHFEKALMMFSAMNKAVVKANQFSYASVLKACTMMGCLERGMQIQGCIQKGRFFDNLYVQSALIDLHSKLGKMEDACYVFEMMIEKDVVGWNAMIGGFSVQGFCEDSFLMFRLMLREGMMPDRFTFGSILRACSGASSLIKVSQIHGIITQLGFESNPMVSGSLIDAFAKCGSVKSANHIYNNMPAKDLISCTALITGYAREGCYSTDALNIFSEMIHMQMKMDDVILCSMLCICANIALLSLGTQLHGQAVKLYQSTYDVAMGNALIDMYAKSGEIKDANRAFNELEKKNVISWTSMIYGHAKNGNGQKAIELYDRMERSGSKPNDITFLSLLFACCHTGLTSEGWDCFNKMVTKYNIMPRAEHYTCMIDLYARGGRLEEAYDLISNMNVEPNASLWGSILGACNIYGNMLLGEVAAENLFHLNPGNSVNYVTLSNIYTSVGSWVDASNARKLMEEKRLEKNPGYSIYQPMQRKTPLLQEV